MKAVLCIPDTGRVPPQSGHTDYCFCRACLEYLLLSGSQPHILHVHEWQTSALPLLYWDKYHNDGLKRPRIVLTLHNLDNSGECRQDEFGYTGAALIGPSCICAQHTLFVTMQAASMADPLWQHEF